MNTLPRDVFTVSKRELEQFKQGRRVGCYLLGKTVGEGSFAKVKEAIHIVTGEEVKNNSRQEYFFSKRYIFKPHSTCCSILHAAAYTRTTFCLFFPKMVKMFTYLLKK